MMEEDAAATTMAVLLSAAITASIPPKLDRCCSACSLSLRLSNAACASMSFLHRGMVASMELVMRLIVSNCAIHSATDRSSGAHNRSRSRCKLNKPADTSGAIGAGGQGADTPVEGRGDNSDIAVQPLSRCWTARFCLRSEHSAKSRCNHK